MTRKNLATSPSFCVIVSVRANSYLFFMAQSDLDHKVQQEIIEAFRNDRNAFEKIYDFYYEMIFRYLIKRTMSAEVAYDLAADTFIKAFESFDRFKWTGVSIKCWLYRIAINSLKNYRRNPGTSPFTDRIEGDERFVEDVKEELKELDKAVFGDEEVAKLSDAIATLKPEHQNIISLYYFNGMSQNEIAQTTNTTVSAVKARMHRATKQLRQILSPNFI